MSFLESKNELSTFEYEIEEEREEESIEEEYLRPEDLLAKNTSSFQCLTQVNISRSSLLLDPYYWFPELPDPNLDAFLLADGRYFYVQTNASNQQIAEDLTKVLFISLAFDSK